MIIVPRVGIAKRFIAIARKDRFVEHDMPSFKISKNDFPHHVNNMEILGQPTTGTKYNYSASSRSH